MPPEADAPPCPRRTFGETGVFLSAFTFGTMRLAERGFDEAGAADFAAWLFDRGVTSFHVSHEYESHPLACAAIRGLRRRRPGARIEIVAKLASPHFDQTAFDADRARGIVEDLRRDLEAERIDVVQWMARHTPNEDAPRLAILERDAGAMEATWAALKAQGKVGALSVFPYSDAFLRAALDYPWIDGVVSYLNFQETEAAPYLDRLAAEGRGFCAIRPLNAGKLAADAEAAIAFPLLHPATASVILTASSRERAATALRAVAGAHADAAAFHAALRPA
ncbi:aldo/keto reductase [Phenylobacterium sp.]|uniref:aldo/keto reductase n=1 Tax=Phenylobacterium sp. TaxID=1871053 RepID=UPI0035B1B2CB